jgi:hypothetical protein
MTPLPEEAVKAAHEAARVRDIRDERSMRERVVDALTAALPFLPVQGAVKKLEWNEYEREGQIEEWDASSGFDGYYNITLGLNGYLVKMPDDEEEFETLEAAKAAAQADYEARILSALEPSAARELALEEGYRRGVEAAAKLIECGCKSLLHGKGECQFPGNCTLEDAAAIRALSSPDHADAGKVEGDGWLPIGKDTPKDTVVLLAWKYQAKWEYEAGLYGSTRGGWLHGQASHWRPLPTPPSSEVA